MGFGDQPLIPGEDTDAGSYFKETFIMLWNEGKTAKEIAEELQFFDKPMFAPWSGKLLLRHVYYFAKKWKLPKRKTMSPTKKGFIKYHPSLPQSVVQAARATGKLLNDPL